MTKGSWFEIIKQEKQQWEWSIWLLTNLFAELKTEQGECQHSYAFSLVSFIYSKISIHMIMLSIYQVSLYLSFNSFLKFPHMHT